MLFGPASGLGQTRTSAAFSTPPGLELFDTVRRLKGPPADAAYVDSVRQTSQLLVKLDTVHGGDDIFALALHAFRQAHQKLSTGAYAPKVERDLMAATGESGEVAAWLAYDADRQETSRQIIHEALLLSRQAGDRDMELLELSHLTMQSTYLHRPAEALRISGGLLDGGEIAPRVAALFAIRQGRALAQLGDGSGAFNALDRARSVLAEGVSARDPHWTWWVTDAEVAWHRGMSHAELGDWGGSVEPFHESAGRRGTYRRARYNDLTHLLNALTHVRAWQEAEPVIVELAGQIGEVRSTRTTNLLRRAVRRVKGSHAPSTVDDAAEHVRKALGHGAEPV